MGGPGPPDQATHGDDRVGQVEEGVDHALAAFVAALQPVEAVVPGVRALDMPTAGGLDRRFLPLVRDLAAQPAFVQQGAGLVRVVPAFRSWGERLVRGLWC